MTIEKPILQIVKNNIGKHQNETMALLKKLLVNKGMNQIDLAKELHRDKTTVNRWVKNSREITWENAEKIAAVLKVHPVEVYQPKSEIVLKYYVDSNYTVQKFDEDNLHKISIPFEFYHPNVRAVQFNMPGSFWDGQVVLFDIPKIKKFNKFAIGKFCYCTPSKAFLKKNKNAKNAVVGVLKTNEDNTLKIIHPITQQPINKYSVSFMPEDLEIATPVKAKYDPELLNIKLI
jgi:transcriptional regulator with XRE-family HTH domain